MLLSKGQPSKANTSVVRVLVVEDDEADFSLIQRSFAEIPGTWFVVDWVSTYEAGMEEVVKKHHDVVLIDYQLGDHTGLDILRQARHLGCEPVIVTLTGLEAREIDLEAIRSGASDYVIKASLTTSGLDRTVRYALERKRLKAERDQLTAQLIDSSRRVGMADVASSVLHNVGNVLNSVNISADLVSQAVHELSIDNVARTATLLKEHESTLETYLNQDPKGKRIPEYLDHLGRHLSDERAKILKELEGLVRNIDHIKQIIAAQQNIARSGVQAESTVIVDVMEQALDLGLSPKDHEWIAIVRDYQELPSMQLDKHQVLQILVNLIRNAKQAMQVQSGVSHSLILRIGFSTESEHDISFQVSDSGIGVAKEDLSRLFHQGFTTKKDGHGFGLHHGALAAQQMGGALTASSDGQGKGATFTLELPANVEVGSV